MMVKRIKHALLLSILNDVDNSQLQNLPPDSPVWILFFSQFLILKMDRASGSIARVLVHNDHRTNDNFRNNE